MGKTSEKQKKYVLRYYCWGSEKPGYVSTWRFTDESGNYKLCGEIPRAELPQGSIHDCPWS